MHCQRFCGLFSHAEVSGSYAVSFGQGSVALKERRKSLEPKRQRMCEASAVVSTTCSTYHPLRTKLKRRMCSRYLCVRGSYNVEHRRGQSHSVTSTQNTNSSQHCRTQLHQLPVPYSSSLQPFPLNAFSAHSSP